MQTYQIQIEWTDTHTHTHTQKHEHEQTYTITGAAHETPFLHWQIFFMCHDLPELGLKIEWNKTKRKEIKKGRQKKIETDGEEHIVKRLVMESEAKRCV